MADDDNKSGGSSSSDQASNQDQNNQTDDPTAQLHSVYRPVKVPPFWNKNPQLWFLQLDAQFSICRVTAEQVKFHHVVAALDMEVLSQVSDLVQNQPARPYTALKQRLIASYGESDERRIKRLLKELELGDKRPSHLLQEMRQIAGNLVTGELLKSLWMQQLPASVRAVVSASGEDLSVLAILADKVIEVTTSNYENCSVSARSLQVPPNILSDQVSQLQSQVSALTKQLSEYNFQRPSRSDYRGIVKRSPSRGRSPSLSRSKSRSDVGLCWYHRRFAGDATRCTKPCSFPEN